MNQIEEVCKDIEKTINQTIQNTLNTLEKDCERIAEIIDDKIQRDRYVEYPIRWRKTARESQRSSIVHCCVNFTESYSINIDL